ncbi:MAG TPA: serine/threonine-protein kinase, partial [Acidimicrobiia bacterium]|nr:serine/threonine-protein kinase [Acidimicrobiia bacterium]
ARSVQHSAARTLPFPRVPRTHDGKNQDMSSSAGVIGQRYQLGPVLGRGGMGQIRAATDLRLAREVAVKFLRVDLAEQATIRGRFEREARAAARIAHPNVVAIYDIGEDDGAPFIVMERLSGTTLADELSAGPLSQARACSLTLEILSALDAAHRLGVIHRDIKPANILLDDLGHAKVADFGIAKIAEDANHTTIGMLFGTPSYLAPERIAGEAATPASDLYAVGVLLFEVLAGRPPFRGETPLALVQSIARGVQEPLNQLRSDLDPGVVAVVEQAMQPDPKDRYHSAPSMAAALAAATQRSQAAQQPTVRVPTVPTVGVDTTQRARAVGPTAPPATVAMPSETQRLTRPETAAGVGAGPRFAIRRAATLVVVAMLVVAAAVLYALHSKSGSATRPPATVAQPATAIPAQLKHAIDALDRSVRP